MRGKKEKRRERSEKKKRFAVKSPTVKRNRGGGSESNETEWNYHRDIGDTSSREKSRESKEEEEEEVGSQNVWNEKEEALGFERKPKGQSRVGKTYSTAKAY